MIKPGRSIPEILVECLKAALRNRDSAAACRARLEAIAEAELASGLVELFKGPWQLSQRQIEEMRGWPAPQLALLRSSAVIAARRVEATGVALDCVCTGRAGVPRALHVTLAEPGFLAVEFVGPELV